MNSAVRWGILGTGNIARQFCADVRNSAGGPAPSFRSRLSAIGSRSIDSARRFAADYAISSAGDYESVLADKSVDAIYIALPNTMHFEWTLRALRAGKHVLCEKPISVTAAEAEEMFAEARRRGRVLMEAFMYRCHPLTHAVMAAVRAGRIGKVRLVRSSFCYRSTKVDGNIRFDSELEGGGLMDIGCYCINFSRMVAGEEPHAVQAFAHRHQRGTDDVAVGAIQFPGGIVASFTCGTTVQADNAAYICGDDGYIVVPVPWKPPARGAVYTIAHSTPTRMDNPAGVPAAPPFETHSVDANLDLYALEAEAFAAAVLDGTPLPVSAADAIGNMRTLEQMRRQTGWTPAR